MRIRTDEYPHRRETVERAAEVWDCNLTMAVLLSCELAVTMYRDLPRHLEDDRIPPGVARSIVEDLEGSYLKTQYDGPSVSFTPRD